MIGLTTTSGTYAITMRAEGYYNAHARPQRSFIEMIGMPLLRETLASQRYEGSDRPFLIADLGCAEGGNSLEPMHLVIDWVHELDPERSIIVSNCDVPSNDFGSMFRAVSGPGGYSSSNVTPVAVAGSFYEDLLPPDSVDLAWCATAVHWVSRIPGPVPGAIQVVSATPEQQRPWREQAADDWRAFLQARRRELRSGGSLTLITVGVDDDGRCDAEPTFAALVDVVASMVREGTITSDEAATLTLPFHYRSTQEFRAPFEAGEVDGLTLDFCGITHAPDVLAPLLDDSPEAFADAWTAYLRAFMENGFSSGPWLAADRSSEERAAIADRFFEGFRTVVLEDPAAVTSGINIAAVRVVRD